MIAGPAALALACLLAAASLVPGLPVRASDDHEAARALVGSGDILPLESILEAVQHQYPGRLLEAELDREDGTWVYELEILTEEGRVLELEYDAHSGELRKTKRED